MPSPEQPMQPSIGDPFPEPDLGCAEADDFEVNSGEALRTNSAAWRAEVASRVSSYRSRQGRRAAERAASLPLDFQAAGEPAPPVLADSGEPLAEPSYPVPSILECPPPPPASVGTAALEFATEFSAGELSPHALARLEELRNAAHSAFDTMYYRRRNLESLSAAAESAAQELPPAFDLELHGATDGNACLDRYSIAEAAPTAEEESFALTEAEQSSEPSAVELDAAAQGNLIYFPRPLLEPPLLPKPSRDELAEPVGQRPRILEVPEDILPAEQGMLFPEIRLDGEEAESEALREAELAVPLPVAPFSARLQAALLDSATVAAAGALFTAIAWRGLPGVPHAKPFWLAMAGVTLLLWAVYQLLFLLYAGRTLGMALLGMELSTFEGERPDWLRRRRRVLFLFVSTASMMLGNLWALLDKDMLCWHDRLSQTFPTQEPGTEQEPE